MPWSMQGALKGLIMRVSVCIGERRPKTGRRSMSSLNLGLRTSSGTYVSLCRAMWPAASSRLPAAGNPSNSSVSRV